MPIDPNLRGPEAREDALRQIHENEETIAALAARVARLERENPSATKPDAPVAILPNVWAPGFPAGIFPDDDPANHDGETYGTLICRADGTNDKLWFADLTAEVITWSSGQPYHRDYLMTNGFQTEAMTGGWLTVNDGRFRVRGGVVFGRQNPPPASSFDDKWQLDMTDRFEYAGFLVLDETQPDLPVFPLIEEDAVGKPDGTLLAVFQVRRLQNNAIQAMKVIAYGGDAYWLPRGTNPFPYDGGCRFEGGSTYFGSAYSDVLDFYAFQEDITADVLP